MVSLPRLSRGNCDKDCGLGSPFAYLLTPPIPRPDALAHVTLHGMARLLGLGPVSVINFVHLTLGTLKHTFIKHYYYISFLVKKINKKETFGRKNTNILTVVNIGGKIVGDSFFLHAFISEFPTFIF